MPAVGLALGGRLRKRRAGVGAHPPLLAWRRQAREVAVLHTLLSGRARLRSEVLARWVKPAGARTAQHLTSQINGWCFTHFPCRVTVTPINSFSTPPQKKQRKEPLAGPLPCYSPPCRQHIGSCCTPPPSGCCGETGAQRGGSSSQHLRLHRHTG